LMAQGDQVEVSLSNRAEFVRLAEAVRLEEALPQVWAVRRGLVDLVPHQLLKLCTADDLMQRVCGRPLVDIQLLKRHTEYSGVVASAPHIAYFWEVLESFTQDERRAFIQFAWAQERLPATDAEFDRTGTRMMIKPYTGTSNPDDMFPKADTCFFNLMLPEYSSPELLRQRLLFAVHTDADSMNADVPQDDSRRPAQGLLDMMRGSQGL